MAAKGYKTREIVALLREGGVLDHSGKPVSARAVEEMIRSPGIARAGGRKRK
jgi:hypothetical protein